MIYLDHAATSPMRKQALEAMWPYMTNDFGNPSSTHGLGKRARTAMEDARADIADVLGAQPGEIIFTAGGTEADNLVIRGIAKISPKGRHIVTTAIEHKALLATFDDLESTSGFIVSYVPVDATGRVNAADIAAALRPDTTICSVMYANNEVGTVQPIKEIAAVCKDKGVVFHTDAVQAAGALPLGVDTLGVDAMTLSAHKFGGPKGVGALYLRSPLLLTPLTTGGGQERGLRSGTENVAAAVGMAVALSLSSDDDLRKSESLLNALVEGVLAKVTGATLTGHPTHRLPGHASFCIEGTFAESVLIELDRRGVLCSSGAACDANSEDTSHVLDAMGYTPDLARTAIRFSLGPSTTQQEVDAAVEALVGSVASIRVLT